MHRAWQGNRTLVRRLRIRASGAEPSRDAARVSGMLAASDVGAAGLPPSSILCVRRLGDPRPRVFRPAPGAYRPADDWERAVSARLAALARGAARPVRGRIGGDAAVVLFADEAELLACL